MRWKISDMERLESDYRCCFRCHVRTGTIIFGVLQMVCEVFVLVVLLSSLINPRLNFSIQVDDDASSGNLTVLDDEGNRLPQREFSLLSLQSDPTASGRCITYAVSLFSFLLCAMMTYGAIKYRPAYLLPHFILQVFDFTITCLTVIGCFGSVASIKQLILSKTQSPVVREQIELIEPTTLALIFMISLTVALLVKAYLLNMVWSTYRYLVQLTAVPLPRYIINDDSKVLLPPKYEEACKTEAPPVYSP